MYVFATICILPHFFYPLRFVQYQPNKSLVIFISIYCAFHRHHTFQFLKVTIDRGYLFSLVKDRYLFHRVDTIGNIFTSGTATRENATCENITNGVHSMK